MTLEEFNHLPLSEKIRFKDQNYPAYRQMFGLSTPVSGKPLSYTPGTVTTIDQFEKLSLEEKLDFKDRYPDQYRALFADGTAPTGKNTAAGVTLNASEVKTPDDFEKLSPDAKLAFKTNYSALYKKLFS